MPTLLKDTMGGHHLILGRLTDYINGETLDDTLDERHRQKIARLLVERKGYAKHQVTPRHEIEINAGGKCARFRITFSVQSGDRTVMVIQYGPGSLVTRHRPALALGRLVAGYQVPVVVVTNGEAADILDGAKGDALASGLDHIPDADQIGTMVRQYPWPTITPERAEMEARIVMAYEVDDSCPCDDSVCRIDADGT